MKLGKVPFGIIFACFCILVNGGKYPDGPPACGSSGDPDCDPTWTAWDDPLGVALFTIFAILLTIIGLYSFLKYTAVRVRAAATKEWAPFEPKTSKADGLSSKRRIENHRSRANTTDSTRSDRTLSQSAPLMMDDMPRYDIDIIPGHHTKDLKTRGDSESTDLRRESSVFFSNKRSFNRGPSMSVVVGKSTDVSLILERHFVVVGYKDYILGHMGMLALKTLVAFFWIVYFGQLFDMYWDCQVTSVDNQCYYGSYPITGWNNEMGKRFLDQFFFTFWWLWLVLFGTLLFFKNTLTNWFRQVVDLDDADYVYVWVADEEEILCTDPTWIVDLSRKINAWFKTTFSLGDSGHSETVEVETITVEGEVFKTITFEFSKYVIRKNELYRVEVNVGELIGDLALKTNGLSTYEAENRLKLIGENNIPFEVDSWFQLFKDEYFTLFYYYQGMIYLVWFYWSYLFTAGAEFLIVMVSVATAMYLKRRSQETIATLTKGSSKEEVLRDGKWIIVDSKELVPEDIFVVQTDSVVPCDCVLVKGTAVLDEAGLTGESMPISKVPATAGTEKKYGDHGSTRYTLFAGTNVLQAGSDANERVLAIVMKTGISTNKGTLVAHILHPTEMSFKYDEEYTVAFVLLLFYGIFLFCFNIWLMGYTGTNAFWVIKFLRGIFIVSQMLSPLLPLSLLVGQAASSKRLYEDMSIFCINPKRINICGKIRVCCFDKTGTLTKEGLDFLGVVPIMDGELQEKISVEDGKVDQYPHILHGLATCHAVSKYGTQLVGNQVEVKMFEATGWKLVDVSDQQTRVESDEVSLTIEKRFEFDHGLMRMSVIISDGSGARIYCKGAAETIAEMCDPATLPKDYIQVAKQYAKDGCYVLGLASARINPDEPYKTFKRNQVEKEGTMECLGLILFRNELKDDTTEALIKLRQGDCRLVMITGDNAQCGYYVAKKSTMIAEDAQVYLAEKKGMLVTWTRMDVHSEEEEHTVDIPEYGPNVEYAMTGAAYDHLVYTGDMEDLLLKTRIYARFSPEQKEQVVSKIMQRGLVVGMCGDGGNDCGALSMAHAGLALSEAEASVVSPFTANTKSVMAMVHLLREGRASLATSFAAWKFIITFGQAYVFSRIAAGYFDVVMPSMDFLFVDVVILLSLSWALGFALPLDELGSERPTASLLGPYTVLSIGGVTLINFIFCVITWFYITNEPAYIKWPIKCEDGNSWWLMGDNWESMVCFVTFVFQMFHACFVFSFGTRFRKVVWRNWILCALIVFFWIFFSVILLSDRNALTDGFHFCQENHNRYRSPSTTWNTYQNVNEHGFPMFQNDPTIDKCAAFAGEVWGDLYTQVNNPSGELDPIWASEGNYVPGQNLPYDSCVYSVCIANNPGCECGQKDGEFGMLATDDYQMSKEIRFNLWIIIVINQLCSWLWVYQGVEGIGRRTFWKEKDDYLHIDL